MGGCGCQYSMIINWHAARSNQKQPNKAINGLGNVYGVVILVAGALFAPATGDTSLVLAIIGSALCSLDKKSQTAPWRQ